MEHYCGTRSYTTLLVIYSGHRCAQIRCYDSDTNYSAETRVPLTINERGRTNDSK